MAKIVQAELWDLPPPPRLVVVTTNSVVNNRGVLIMERGSAGDAVELDPEIQAEVTAEIHRQRPEIKLDGTQDYGFLIVRPTPRGFGVLQAKRHWQDVSAWETISLALTQLHAWATKHPDVQIRCSAPGLGCGRIGRGVPIPRERIIAACEKLPDTVTFCFR